ncbi:MAG: ABC transporter ATP-binding protein [Steroidobacteraceae bacterium]
MIIQVDGLHKAFGAHEALRGLSLSVSDGSAYALIGANGAGKTTTIKVLTNIMQPSRGAATLFGVDSRRLSHREFAQIGYVSENQQLPVRMTVGRYLEYLRPFYPSWDRHLEGEILSELRLPRDRKIGHLSHGMRLKMALACALPFRPKLLVLDEPFSGLDPLIRDEFMERLLRQAGEMTIFISSHELAEIEGVTTHVGFIDRGRLLFEESMTELSGRIREVRVTLEREAVAPNQVPEGWIQLTAEGNVLSFVDTHFRQDRLADRISGLFQEIRNIDVRPIALRSIFTTLARAARDEGI